MGTRQTILPNFYEFSECLITQNSSSCISKITHKLSLTYVELPVQQHAQIVKITELDIIYQTHEDPTIKQTFKLAQVIKS